MSTEALYMFYRFKILPISVTLEWIWRHDLPSYMQDAKDGCRIQWKDRKCQSREEVPPGYKHWSLYLEVLSHDNISLSAHNLFFNQQNTGGQLHALKMEWQELCQKNIAIQAACVDLQNHIDQLKLEAKELYVYSLLPPSPSLSLGLFIVWLQPSPTQESDHSKPHRGNVHADLHRVQTT